MITEDTKRAIIKITPELVKALKTLQANIKEQGKVSITLEALIECAFETGMESLNKQYPTPIDTGQGDLMFEMP